MQMTKLQNILLILDTIPVESLRKRNLNTWKQKLASSRKTVRTKRIRKKYKRINEFKKGYQPCAYVIKKDEGTVVADPTSILSRWE